MISTSIVCLATAAAYFSRIILECSVAVDVGGQPFPGIVSHLICKIGRILKIRNNKKTIKLSLPNYLLFLSICACWITTRIKTTSKTKEEETVLSHWRTRTVTDEVSDWEIVAPNRPPWCTIPHSVNRCTIYHPLRCTLQCTKMPCWLLAGCTKAKIIIWQTKSPWPIAM